MSTDNNSSVLAIGIDAAESTLVRQMIEQNELPALRSLLAEGKWLEVRSPAPIGSGTVWPTFLTGEEPAAHRIYSEWKWLPETMSLRRYEGHHLTPFWKSLADDGESGRMRFSRSCKPRPRIRCRATASLRRRLIAETTAKSLPKPAAPGREHAARWRKA